MMSTTLAPRSGAFGARLDLLAIHFGRDQR
jgi:hypothetical protein